MAHRGMAVSALMASFLFGGGAAARADDEIFFAADFDEEVPKQFSGVTSTSKVQGYANVGWPGNRFSGKFLHNSATGNPAAATTLTLTKLPAHTSISVGFLLALIDSWDGSSAEYGPPDVFNVTVDDKVVFSRHFSNFTPAEQEYKPPQSGRLLRRPFVDVGFDTAPDSAYDMGRDRTFYKIPHTSDTLRISWYASGAGYRLEATDESWAIDNVVVILSGTAPTAIRDLLDRHEDPLEQPRHAFTPDVEWQVGRRRARALLSADEAPTAHREASVIRMTKAVSPR